MPEQEDVLAKVVQNSLPDLKFESFEIESSPQVLNQHCYKCTFCINEIFENQESLNHHLAQKHPDNPNVLQYSIFGSVSQNDLTSFLKKNENNQDDDKAEENSKKFEFNCDICKKLFTCNEHLQNHEFDHMHGKNFAQWAKIRKKVQFIGKLLVYIVYLKS